MLSLFLLCAPEIHPQTLNAIISVESNYNQFAIGVVGSSISQPKSFNAAIIAINQLKKNGKNFSIGLGQINRYNLDKWKVSYAEALDPCTNLKLAQRVILDCYIRANKQSDDKKWALLASFSCYYSGNFRFGFTQDFKGQKSYVQKIVSNKNIKIPNYVVPAINDADPTLYSMISLPKKKLGKKQKAKFSKSSSSILVEF